MFAIKSLQNSHLLVDVKSQPDLSNTISYYQNNSSKGKDCPQSTLSHLKQQRDTNNSVDSGQIMFDMYCRKMTIPFNTNNITLCNTVDHLNLIFHTTTNDKPCTSPHNTTQHLSFQAS